MYSYPYQKDQLISPTKALFLGMLCAVWLLTGLIGHDPWKPDEASSFGLVYHILKSGDWLVPTLADDAFLERPPLFYWSAAIFAKLFAPFLPLHDGARLATGFYMGLTLLFTGLSGRELFGKSAGWASAIMLIGSMGLLVRAHLMVADMALLTGCAMMVYGYALSIRRHIFAGFLLGTGVGIGFLAKGFIAPIFFLFISATLLFFPIWRRRTFYTSLGIALVSTLPWLTIWPTLLYLHSPELFAEWLWQFNVGRWFEHVHDVAHLNTLYYISILPWFAWPAFPLAIWSVWEARKKMWQSEEFQLLLVSFVGMLLTLSLSSTIDELSALPMLLPLSLLGTAALFTLRRGAANALDWFGIMTFALLAILLWWGWTGLLVDSPAKITQLLKDYRPGFEPVLQVNQFWIAVAVTLLWMVLVWRVGRSIRRSVINWAAGVTLLWLLAVTLWMPWLNSGKSYRLMVTSLKQALPAKYNCIYGIDIGDGQRAMLQYFGDITISKRPKKDCTLMLVQGSSISPPVDDKINWKSVWDGSRTGDKNERFWLYRRVKK
jgi:4-amino-4-deoxy-L-arabinose transferase-like glycosyltransferase